MVSRSRFYNSEVPHTRHSSPERPSMNQGMPISYPIEIVVPVSRISRSHVACVGHITNVALCLQYTHPSLNTLKRTTTYNILSISSSTTFLNDNTSKIEFCYVLCYHRRETV